MKMVVEIILPGIVFAIGFMGCLNTGPKSIEADLVLRDGKIWTLDPANPVAESVAIWNGQIVAVGRKKDIEKLIGKNTQIIDVKGKLVLPGFIDSHTHIEMGGFHLLGVDLRDAENEKEFGELLKAKSEELGPDSWITGGYWDHDKWPGAKLPSAELVDKYVPDRPVFVLRYDGHMAVANSMALKLARITKKTPDPKGGLIDRKPGTTEPTGVLRDAAIGLVQKAIPAPSEKDVRHSIEAVLEHARKNGMTSLHQVDVTPLNLTIYQELLNEEKLTSRIYGFVPIEDLNEWVDMGIQSNFGNNWISIGGVKGFLDGSLGSSTAKFDKPYTQDPTTTGIFVNPPEKLFQLILDADKAKLQVAIHAIGDRANSVMLDIFSKVIEKNGPRDRRFRIEHAQHMNPSDFKRFGELGIIASMQPYHAIDDGRFAERRIGKERCQYTYAFHSFLDNGVKLAFGSDFPVAPLNALAGIYAAVTRRTLDEKNPEGWIPEQKITVEQAIKGYTLDAAYSQFQEEIKGSIACGKLADLVVLSQDILTIPPEDIGDTDILYTIVGGQVVYSE